MRGIMGLSALLLISGLAAGAGTAYAGSCGSKCRSEKKDLQLKACGHKQECGHGNKETLKEAQHEYGLIDTKGMKKLHRSKEKPLLLDARSGKFDDGRRMPGAKQLAADASEDEIKAALPDKNAKIVAYCTNEQCPASAMLAERLVKLGYENVHKYPPGIDGWEKAGGKTTQAKQ